MSRSTGRTSALSTVVQAGIQPACRASIESSSSSLARSIRRVKALRSCSTWLRCLAEIRTYARNSLRKICCAKISRSRHAPMLVAMRATGMPSRRVSMALMRVSSCSTMMAIFSGCRLPTIAAYSGDAPSWLPATSKARR